VLFYLAMKVMVRPHGHSVPAAPGQSIVQLTYGQTSYRLVGPTDGPVVVLIHGFSLSILWSMGRPYEEVLVDQGYRVLNYDLYGRGSSAAPDVRYDEKLFVGQLVELLFKLNLTRSPIILVGASMGGLVAARFTQLHPEKVSKLVLFAPVGFGIEENLVFRLLQTPVLGDIVYRLLGKKAMLDRVDVLYPPGTSYEPAGKVVRAHFVNQIENNPSYLPALLRTVRDFPMDEMKEPYYTIGSRKGFPVLLLWGDNDDTVPYSESCVQALPNAKLIVFKNATHDAVVLDQDVVQGAIVNFLGKAQKITSR